MPKFLHNSAWSKADAKVQDNAMPAAGTGDWLGDFVNHLAQAPAQRDPNAGLRVQISANARVSAELSVLWGDE